jgi:hypothetical protein
VSLKILSPWLLKLEGCGNQYWHTESKWVFNLSIFMVTFMILWVKLLND